MLAALNRHNHIQTLSHLVVFRTERDVVSGCLGRVTAVVQPSGRPVRRVSLSSLIKRVVRESSGQVKYFESTLASDSQRVRVLDSADLVDSTSSGELVHGAGSDIINNVLDFPDVHDLVFP